MHYCDTEIKTLGPSNPTWGIFLISVVGLFLEMLLIRWVATEVRIFAYLQNTVLIVCFLGLGMGCFTCRRRIDFRPALVLLLTLTALFAIPVVRTGLGKIGTMLSVLDDMEIWYPDKGRFHTSYITMLRLMLGLSLTFLLMLLIWEIFIPIGRLLGRLMGDHPHTIWAYSANIAGSLVGIWLFVLLSAWQQPPVTWFAVLCAMMLFFLGTKRRERTIGIVLLVGILLFASIAGLVPGAIQVIWSPYQKLVLSEDGDDYVISVNNIPYQSIKDLRQQTISRDSGTYLPHLTGLSQYDVPYQLHPDPQRVLVVGAGAGNDVAGALRHGVSHVTAVEIDPVIFDMGQQYHPERPYDSDRVMLINDDARAYFAKCRDRFDLICFGLLDSHTSSSMNNARLDHFVYTQQSIAQARSLLNPGGVVVLSFEASKPYIADRMARVLRDVFGQDPFVFRIPYSSLGWGGVHFVSGDLNAVNGQLAAHPRLAQFIKTMQNKLPVELSYTTKATTDNWPYIYLQSPRIPTIYWLLAMLLGLLFGWGKIRFGKTGWLEDWSRSHWHFFFLGTGFLLLEVVNISRSAAVLGNTWWVNAVIISGVLCMILLANAIAVAFPKLPIRLVYTCLCASCLGLYFLDINRFGALPFVTKAAALGILTTLPILFSGIIFIRSFNDALHKDLALGANLLGALVGGLLQTLTFILGISALFLLVTALYLCAFLTGPTRKV